VDDTVARARPPQPEFAYAQRLHGTATPNAVAGVMGHPEWIVPKGTVFHCLPQQPLDTQLPGPVKCLVTDEVWSAVARQSGWIPQPPSLSPRAPTAPIC
jgi:type IV secretory pathway VirB10-like protein